MPPVILHHLLNVFVQLANKRGFTKQKTTMLPRAPDKKKLWSFWLGVLRWDAGLPIQHYIAQNVNSDKADLFLADIISKQKTNLRFGIVGA
jgi:hypothetical protein